MLLAALLSNLLVVGRLDPSDPTESAIPLAGQCQGGGPGCADQPLIPPTAQGLPRFDAPSPIFGALVAVEPAPPRALPERPPDTLERPPRLAAAT
jgi:hypothetical protein